MRKTIYSNLALFEAVLTQEGETMKIGALKYECVIVQDSGNVCVSSANALQ